MDENESKIVQFPHPMETSDPTSLADLADILEEVAADVAASEEKVREYHRLMLGIIPNTLRMVAQDLRVMDESTREEDDGE